MDQSEVPRERCRGSYQCFVRRLAACPLEVPKDSRARSVAAYQPAWLLKAVLLTADFVLVSVELQAVVPECSGLFVVAVVVGQSAAEYFAGLHCLDE